MYDGYQKATVWKGLYDTLLDFGKDREGFQFMKSNEAKAFISYLADIFGKLNALNKELQGEQKTLMDCKTKMFGFISKLGFLKAQVLRNNLSHFPHLSKCDPSQNVLQIISEHLSNLHDDLSDRFIDLKQMNFPSWIAQPFLFNWENNDCLARMESDQIDELMDM
ncbi:zinc finger BED domain-containing protein 5-like [Homarus americanus]|uniref:zinc finger BED domain-containing protein 5-like n=1 Tax=Homarus americanus TaxID=6706 RepID=UPI001C47FA31|nr:zinc finger BED domain-containing protein 5-like [Homarus americanus]